jgi:hypothetical protein
MVGRCICNGHSEHCEPFDASRPRLWLCRCDVSLNLKNFKIKILF